VEQIAKELLQAMARPPDPRDTRTVQEVIDMYLAQLGDEITDRTRELRERTLKIFSQYFGKMPVAQCTPIALKEWLAERHNWSSGWSKQRVNADIQRVFNWAASLRYTRENPFRGLQIPRGKKLTGREMTPAEFQAVLRATDPPFRRFLMMMKLTGARNGELAGLLWRQIDWEKGAALLEKHKTSRKTGKPRLIVFPPPAMKFLAWLFRHRYGSAAVELQRILQSAPDRCLGIREVAKKMMAKGFTYRQIYGARRLIGATFERVGGWGDKGRTVYRLPAYPIEAPPPHADFVFLCGKRRPWTRTALGLKFKRLRKKLGLPMSCPMYGLRHAFISHAVRRGLPLKAIACLVGHVDTRMIEAPYCHVGEDFDYLRTAALQAIGHAPVPQKIVQPAPAPEAETNGTPAAAPPPAPGSPEELIRPLVRQIALLEQQLTAAKQAPKGAKLNPSHEMAFAAFQWALRQKPELEQARDEDVYAFLRSRPEWEGKLPPTFTTFGRYIRRHRKLVDGRGKREARRLHGCNRDPEKGGPHEKLA
jgi:integrase